MLASTFIKPSTLKLVEESSLKNKLVSINGFTILLGMSLNVTSSSYYKNGGNHGS